MVDAKLASAKREILDAVDPLEFYKEYYPDWSGDENDLVKCYNGSKHKSGEDEVNSLSINPETGAFYCNGCGTKGTSIVGWYVDAQCDGKYKKGIIKLYSRYIRITADPREVKKGRIELTGDIRAKILSKRGWNSSTLDKLKIGWCPDRKRTVIPIYHPSGILLDLRFHDTLNMAPKNKKGKRIPMLAPAGGKTGDFFPVNPLVNPFSTDHDTIWVVEGEPDAILAMQDGLNCVTVTGGANVWAGISHEKLSRFKGKNVIVCLDNDKAGERATEEVLSKLCGIDIRSAKAIKVPRGNDISDFFLKYGGSAAQLREQARKASYQIQPTKRNRVSVPLHDTSLPEHIGREIVTKVLVNGKHNSPVSIPRRLTMECRTGDKCPRCPCNETGSYEHHILREDTGVLNYLFTKDPIKALKEDLHLPLKCPITIEVNEWQSLEPISMIPAPSTSETSNKFTSRQGYYLGHGIESNRQYKIRAIPAVHPLTKESVLLVAEAKGSHDSIQNFSLTKEDIDDLKETFQGTPKRIIKEVCKTLSRNYTRIRGRWDLHAICDIAFHSPREFNFHGVDVPKGSIEIILFGDPACGKGQVAEGLVNVYDLGSVLSGENASFMGLVGGAQKTDRGFGLVWGAFPINHGRLLVIDEASGLRELDRLTRIRSEGIAEINKGGISASTEANTRAIWIANCRKGRAVGSYSSGVEAIMDLIRKQEDVRRFDLALVVGKGEVSVEEINRDEDRAYDSRFTRERLRKVVLWAWSRSKDDVRFEESAISVILNGANDLSKRYSSTIPLIQGENARFKIAKVAASIAARCFSTDDGQQLSVRKEHAEAAISFIKTIYDKPIVGYRQFSEIERGGSALQRIEDLDEFINGRPVYIRKILVDGLLACEEFSVKDVMDWTSTEGQIAKKYIGIMVRCNAIVATRGGMYSRKPSFNYYLNRVKRKIEKHGKE